MTRKILVPIDINNPEKKVNDFLYPISNEKGKFLKGIKTNIEWNFGMVILTSEFNENDLLKKINDSGVKISFDNHTLNLFKEYLENVKIFKIGNIVEINKEVENFELALKYQRLTKKK